MPQLQTVCSSVALFAALGAATLISPRIAAAQSPATYKIEEDWELVVRGPDPAIHSPQITLFTSPLANSENTYFQLQLNHAADAWFSGGGFQVAAVVEEEVVDRARSTVTSALYRDGDVIELTVVMACINNEFLYAVKNGSSLAWGSFGGPEYLVRMPANGEVDLNDYAYGTSLEAVDIGFGANRVESLRLKSVRLYDTAGGVNEITVNSSP